MKRFIGDAVMSVPLLNALEERYKPLHIICAPVVAQVLENPCEERVFLPLDTRRKPWEVLRSAMELRRQRFGVAVVINHSFRSAVTIRMAGIKRRIGHASEGRSWLLTDPVPYDEDVYEAWSELDLAKPLGIEAARVLPTLRVRDSEKARGLELLEGATIGIQPGATFEAKALPTESLAELCRHLQADGFKLVLLGANAELPAAERLEQKLAAPAVNLVGRSTIRESLGALSNLQLMIGADTGLMHMAAAVGAPTVSVFGPTPAQKWGHYYEPHQVIQSPAGDMSKVRAEDLYKAAATVLSRT
jgi:heptosyltransferase-2